MESSQQRVLTLLIENRGKCLSGEEMGKRLGISRSAVWKAIKALRADGHIIESRTRCGYTLQNDGVLSSQGLAMTMKHPNRLTDMAIYHTLPSTNSALKAMALEGAPEGTVVISDEQSAGRGRMGRSFYSPSGCGIYFSYLFRPNNRSTLPQNITMLASICIARGIQKATGYTPGIKWVNDLYLRGKKICGILTEASMNVEAGCVDYLVMGAGINIYEPHGGYPEDIKDKAGAIMPSGIQWDNTLRLRLMAAILDELSELSASSSFPDYIDEYRRLSIVIGRHVVLTAGNNQKEGVVQGFDDQGHLLLKLDSGPVQSISSGEISLTITD